jgi:abortive infection bacteriophage resistance protein
VKETFCKPPLSVEKQLELLESRGMSVSDRVVAKEFLLHLNYYRVSGYAIHFEEFDDNRKRTHNFKPDTIFEDVIQLYEFDDKLRAILFDFIGHIEVAVRSVMCNVIALNTDDSHWYKNRSLFLSSFTRRPEIDKLSGYDKFIDDIEKELSRSNEIFIKSYYDNYSEPKFPPSWMLIEILPMGNWSKLYQNLLGSALKKEIASHFGQTPKIFESWLHALSVLRNHCAHHSRIWNRSFHISPTLIRAHKKMLKNKSELATYNYTKITPFLIVMNKMLEPLNRKTDFTTQITCLFKAFPKIPCEKMGLSDDIKKELGYE